MIDRWALKYFAFGIRSDKEKFIVWWKSYGCNSFSKIEVRKDYTFDHIDYESEAVDIYTD